MQIFSKDQTEGLDSNEIGIQRKWCPEEKRHPVSKWLLRHSAEGLQE